MQLIQGFKVRKSPKNLFIDIAQVTDITKNQNKKRRSVNRWYPLSYPYLTTILFRAGSNIISPGTTSGSKTCCWHTPWRRDPQESPRQPVSPDFRQQWSPSSPAI